MKKILALIISLPLLVIAAEWQSLNGPPAGRADDMSMGWHPGIPGWVIYAADQTHKLYKSTNEGELWQVPTQDERVDNPTCVITDADNAQLVYIGRNNATPVWKSIDGGANWEPKSTGITNTQPLCFAMDPTNSQIVYVGFKASGGSICLYKTTNGGTTWNPCGDFPQSVSVRDIYIKPDDPNILYLATNNSVYKSADGGTNWTQLTPPLPEGCDIYCVTVNTLQTPNILFASVIVYPYQQKSPRIYKTTNDGGNWDEVFNMGSWPYYCPIPTGITVQKNAPIPGSIMYAIFRTFDCAPHGFYKSENYGSDWVESDEGIVNNNDLVSLVQHPGTAGTLFTGGCAALYKSDNYANTWVEKTKGFKPAEVKNVSAVNGNIYGISYAFDPAGKRVDGITKSIDAGENWHWVYMNGSYFAPPNWSGSDIEIATSAINVVYESFYGEVGAVVKTIDNGLSWYTCLYGGWGIKDLTVSNTNADIVRTCDARFGLASSPGIWRTIDGGGSWERYEFTFEGGLYTIETDPSQSNIIYTAGYVYQKESPIRSFHKSYDGGYLWEQVGAGCFGATNEIAIDPINTSNIFAGGDSGIFKSTNGALLFEKKIDGLSETYVTDLEVDPEEPSILHTLAQVDGNSAANALYCTVDGAAKWFQFTLPPGQYPPSYINDLSIDKSQPEKVYAGTPGGTYVFYPQFINKHLLSSSPEATSFNQGRKMCRVEGTDEIWVTYESGCVIYAVHSFDAGQTWSQKMEIGQGCCPAISNLDNFILGIVYLTTGDEDTIYFSRYDFNNAIWTQPAPVVVSTPTTDLGAPSFAIGDGDDNGRLVYSVHDNEGNTDKVYYRQFDVTNPQPGPVEDVGPGINPCIGFMPGATYRVHVVWEDNAVIYYNSRKTDGTWGQIDIVSTDDFISLTNCHHPSLTVEGSVVYAVWDAEGVSNQQDIYWRHVMFDEAQQRRVWSWIWPVSTTETPSMFPVLTSGFFCAWVENVTVNNTEIYFSMYDPMLWTWLPPTNISNSADKGSVFPHLSHRQDITGTNVYFIWTENSQPPFDIKFTSISIGGGGESGGLPFYIAKGGEAEPSPFCLRRQGYVQYGSAPYQKVDIDNQYVEYQFDNLNPECVYGLTACVYQHGYNNLPLTVKVDDVLIGGVVLLPDTLIKFKKMLPRNFYCDSMIDIKILGNRALCATLVLFEYEKSSGGGGPQSSEISDLSLPKQFSLGQSFPNPMVSETRIDYALPVASTVELTVYNISGQVIRRLIDKSQMPGRYSVRWDGRDDKGFYVPDGVYFYRLNAGAFTETRKLVVVK